MGCPVAQVRLRRGNMVANPLVDECHTILAGVPSTRQTVRGRRQNGHYDCEGAVDSVQRNTIYKTLYIRILGNPLLQKLMLFRVRVVQCCPLVCWRVMVHPPMVINTAAYLALKCIGLELITLYKSHPYLSQNMKFWKCLSEKQRLVSLISRSAEANHKSYCQARLWCSPQHY